ncbi:glycosyl hydrolase family 16 [Mariniflexile fucanivorans]|uniref:Glycosyl hydrolase family 16 n=1 Tax=Mariniflexile fucanivorans TaxID=264023 RepID=A0A4V2QE64_9FLAO|nr:family 16 glycosylhydrolase [Mariniflexile fucanivorans]TCL66877.1 glycosyl hydrolase family 16 [Mariniflexile fucanivorans]
MKNISALLMMMVICFLTLNCKSQSVSVKSEVNPSVVYPFSDPSNSGNWALNEVVSDEFEAATIDEDKWYIVGKFENGKPVYKDPDYPNKNVWKGRAPSQFSGRNYRLEGGKLILETRWEPNFPFADDNKQAWGKDNKIEKFENLTTACFIGRREFKYGYMEIKSKAADAEITSAFWATGSQTELDIFEQFGDHRQKGKEWMDRELWWSIHDWSKEGKGKSVYTEHLDYGFRVADDFHVYGIEWDENGLKQYVDGKLFTQVTKEQVDAYAKEHELPNGWVMTGPIHLWLDQETFPWHGVPDSKEDLELNSPEGKKDDGVVDFEIEYVRVWQKKIK